MPAFNASRRSRSLRRSRLLPFRFSAKSVSCGPPLWRCQRRAASAARGVRREVHRTVHPSADHRRHRPQPAAGSAPRPSLRPWSTSPRD